MKTLRRLCYATLGVAYTHLVFGAIVRISGSGMGCGDNWPKCYGHWFPPFDRPELVIEWTHRLLASLLILSIIGLTAGTILKRREPGVSGRGGVLRPVVAAVGVVFVTAAFGAVTVFLGNPTWATVVHWTLAMTLLAVVTTAAIRAGALGGATARTEPAAASTTRWAYLAAAMAFATVVMGGLTAKFPFGSVACQSFPGCGRNPAAGDGAVWVQLTHRTIAILLVLHLIGMAIAGRRIDGAAIRRATLAAALFGVTQIVVAASMVLFRLPAPLRSLHEAIGVAIWLSTFTLAYLARLATRSEPAGGASGATLPPRSPAPSGEPLPATANVRAASRSALARGAEVQRGGAAADADATLVAEPPEPSARPRSTRERRDVVGHSFPTAVVGEVELIDPDTISAGGPTVAGSSERTLSADAVGTAALIAAVERADATTSPLNANPAPTAGDTAAELSLVAEALAALDTAAPAVDRTMDAPDDRSTDPSAIEASARAVADDMANTLEALEAVELEHDAPDDSEASESDEPVDAAPIVAPAETMSIAAEVQEQAGTTPGEGETDAAATQRPHTMAVIVARGADL